VASLLIAASAMEGEEEDVVMILWIERKRAVVQQHGLTRRSQVEMKWMIGLLFGGNEATVCRFVRFGFDE
jgi:hypothetical protein